MPLSDRDRIELGRAARSPLLKPMDNVMKFAALAAAKAQERRCVTNVTTEVGFEVGPVPKCDQRQGLDFLTLKFGTRRPLVQIQSPRPLL